MADRRWIAGAGNSHYHKRINLAIFFKKEQIMCKSKILKTSDDGYVMHCKGCGQIQVAFGTTIISMTQSKFYEYIKAIDDLYSIHNLYPFKDEKLIKIPTPARGVIMVYSVNELKDLLHMLVEGRNKLEYNKLFVFSEN